MAKRDLQGARRVPRWHRRAAREHRYRPAASPSNSSSTPGQTAGPLSTTEMTLDPHRLAPPHVHADEDE